MPSTPATPWSDPAGQHHHDMVALTVADDRRLINALHHTPPDIAHLLSWSCWRRRHQALARTGHCRRRELQQLSRQA